MNVEISSSAGVIATADEQANLWIWTLEDGSLVSQYAAPATLFGLPLALSPTRTLLAVGQASFGANQVLIYNLATAVGPTVLDLNLFGTEPYSLSFGATDADLYVGMVNKSIQVWNLETQQLITTIDLESPKSWIIQEMVFNRNQQVIAFVNSAREISRWDVASNQALSPLQGHPGNVYALSFSPDGALLASVDGGENLILWNTATWEESHFIANAGGADALAFSPDGHLLAVSGYTENISLWDVQTGSLVTQFKGHSSSVSDVAFSEDGTLLVTVGYDGLVRLWAVP